MNTSSLSTSASLDQPPAKIRKTSKGPVRSLAADKQPLRHRKMPTSSGNVRIAPTESHRDVSVVVPAVENGFVDVDVNDGTVVATEGSPEVSDDEGTVRSGRFVVVDHEYVDSYGSGVLVVEVDGDGEYVDSYGSGVLVGEVNGGTGGATEGPRVVSDDHGGTPGATEGPRVVSDDHGGTAARLLMNLDFCCPVFDPDTLSWLPDAHPFIEAPIFATTRIDNLPPDAQILGKSVEGDKVLLHYTLLVTPLTPVLMAPDKFDYDIVADPTFPFDKSIISEALRDSRSPYRIEDEFPETDLFSLLLNLRSVPNEVVFDIFKRTATSPGIVNSKGVYHLSDEEHEKILKHDSSCFPSLSRFARTFDARLHESEDHPRFKFKFILVDVVFVCVDETREAFDFGFRGPTVYLCPLAKTTIISESEFYSQRFLKLVRMPHLPTRSTTLYQYIIDPAAAALDDSTFPSDVTPSPTDFTPPDPPSQRSSPNYIPLFITDIHVSRRVNKHSYCIDVFEEILDPLKHESIIEFPTEVSTIIEMIRNDGWLDREFYKTVYEGSNWGIRVNMELANKTNDGVAFKETSGMGGLFVSDYVRDLCFEDLFSSPLKFRSSAGCLLFLLIMGFTEHHLHPRICDFVNAHILPTYVSSLGGDGYTYILKNWQFKVTVSDRNVLPGQGHVVRFPGHEEYVHAREFIEYLNHDDDEEDGFHDCDPWEKFHQDYLQYPEDSELEEGESFDSQEGESEDDREFDEMMSV